MSSAPPTKTEAARVRLGASAATSPELLRGLADDTSVVVRAALALNEAAPPAANRALARDADERVRVLLARKLAGLLPNLSTSDQARLQQDTWELLAALVADETVRVRVAIADVVKEMPEAPRELILRLAQDTALPVSEPVVRLSPLLTSEDLLALLAQAPGPEITLAVARRARLDEAVCDTIAETKHSVAIGALLANPSAQIREATLDALIARSVEHVEWHEPLVRRPSLPPRAAQALSEIVATHLLEVLASRADLAPPLGEELRCRLARRLMAANARPAANRGDPTAEQVLAEASTLAARGGLSEEAVLAACRRGDAPRAAALLAVAASVPVSMVDRASSLRSAKGLVSLVWKAGLSMRAAGALQCLLACLAPEAVLAPAPGGRFPLAEEEMLWQLDFLGRMGR